MYGIWLEGHTYSKAKHGRSPGILIFLQAKQSPAKQAQATIGYEGKEPHVDGPLYCVFHISFIFTLSTNFSINM